MAEELVCWKCGTSIADLPMPMGRQTECTSCRAELHVCRMCEFYDPGAAQDCREPMAEEVKDKTRANFCGYFQPRPGAYDPQDDADARAARAQLEALFGGPGQDSEQEDEASEDEARRRLEALFRDSGK